MAEPVADVEFATAMCPWTNVGTLGAVDAGKSTLMGYVLLGLNEFDEGYIRKVFRESAAYNKNDMRLAFLLDPGGPRRKEKQPGVPGRGSLELSHIGLEIDGRPFMIIDAPGHHEFVNWAVVGSSQANVCVLVVDVSSYEKVVKGVESVRYVSVPKEAPAVFRSHLFAARLFGITEFIIVLSHMDRAVRPQMEFAAAKAAISGAFESIDRVVAPLGGVPSHLSFVPTAIFPEADPPSAMNVHESDPTFDWWRGQPSFLALLKATSMPEPQLGPLRFAVERDHNLVAGTNVVLSGKVLSGTIRVGETLRVLPTSEQVRVASLKMRDEREPLDRRGRWHLKTSAGAGEVIGVALRSEGLGKAPFQDLLKRHHRRLLLAHPQSTPKVSQGVRARLFVTGGQFPTTGGAYPFNALAGAQRSAARIEDVHFINDQVVAGPREPLQRGDIAEVSLRFLDGLALDPYGICPENSKVALVQGHIVIAGGFVLSLED